MSKELVFPSERHIRAAIAACGTLEAAKARLSKTHLPSSNATGETKQSWLDQLTSRIDAVLAANKAEADKTAAAEAKAEADRKAAAEAEKKQNAQKNPEGGSPKPGPPQ